MPIRRLVRFNHLQKAGISILAVICLLWGMSPAEASPPVNVLILNSYHQGEEWSDNEISGILSSLQKANPFLVPAIEHLDTKRFPGPEYLLFITQYLKTKYQGKRFDLVFVLDNPALDMITRFRQELFPGVPIVFAGINGYSPEIIQGLDPIAGVAEAQDMAGTLKLALALHPKTRYILVVHDYTSTGRAVRKEMTPVTERLQNGITIHYTPEGTVDDLIAQLKSLHSDSLVLLLTYVTDKSGRTLTREESTRLIVESSPVPVYAMHETRMEHGIVGGMLLEGREHGRQAAEMALRILSQQADAVYTVENSRSRPVFDHRQLVRFNIPIDSLPDNSTVLHQPVSFFQQHRMLLIPGMIVAVLMLTIIAILALYAVHIRKARNALRESEKNLKSFLDAIPESAFMMDLAGRVLTANKTAAERIDITPDDMLNNSIYDLIPEEVGSHRKHQVESIIETKKKISFEDQRLNRWIYNIIAPVLDKTGNVSRLTILGIDITDRKNSEQALAESREKYRLFVETANEGIWAMDADHRTTFVNRRMAEMLGYTKEEMLGRTVESFMFDEDMSDHQAKMGKRRQGQGSDYERRFRCKDGQEVWTRVSAAAILDTTGQFAGSHALLTDITERKRMIDELRENEARFRGYFDLGLIGMAITSPKKGWVECNDCLCNMLGFSQEELLQKTWQELTHPEDVEADTDQFNLVIRGEIDAYRMPKRFVRKNGDVIFTELSVRAVRRSNGQVEHFVAMIQDITERKEAEAAKAHLEAQLQHAQKMEAIGSLAGGIAHDLNNILFPITGLSEMLIDDIPPDSLMLESIEQIHRSAKRGSDLVKQVLAFSRQSNPLKLPIRIQPIMKEAMNLSRATIPRKINITSQIDTNCGMVSADPTQIHQIMMNLITNAFHAVEEAGGDIRIELKEADMSDIDPKILLPFPALPSGMYARITVSDTGIGIDQALISKIFEPYFTTKEQGRGTGLGLSVVHGIVKEYGGDIRVYSETGKGTVFHVYLPLLEDTQDSDTTTVKKYPGGCEKILLVDDEEPIIHLEQMILEKLGYQVTTCTSSPEALDIFKNDPHRFDLVMSDRGMPRMTGDQLAGELLSIRPEIPIILCTGFSTENDEQNARAMGIKGFLLKPVATGDLAAMIRKVLDETAGNDCPKPIDPDGEDRLR